MDERVEDVYGPTWYAATAAPAPERPPLAFDIDVDVCVVGGGIAGLTAAYELARLGWSVALLETNRIAWNASGRNCGFVLPGFGADILRIVDRVGLTAAKRLWTLSEAGVGYVRNVIRDNALDVQPSRGWLDVSKLDNGDELLRTVALLGQDFGAVVEGWPRERVRTVLRSERYFHAIHYPDAFHIHPLNYALGLAALAEQAGVRIFEQTPALEIDPAGVRKRISTPSALVRAGHVVLAGNVHLGALMPALAATLLPVTSYVAVTEPLGERLADAITYAGGVSDSRFANYHYRVVDGDRLLWCGGGDTFARSPRKAGQALSAAIARTYPQLGKPEIAYAWAGTMGFAVHRMPQIGEMSPGVWVASAFGGHGLNVASIAGKLLAHAIVENDDSWRLFEAYELAWAGGRGGRLFHQVRGFLRNRRESVEADLAQRRERRRVMRGQTFGRPAGPEPAAAADPAWNDADAPAAGEIAPAAEALDWRSVKRADVAPGYQPPTVYDIYLPDAETDDDGGPAPRG